MESYIELFIKALGPIVALIGILVTLPIIRKKLLENHIVKKLNEIQEANTEVRIYNERLIDKYLPIAVNYKELSMSDIQNIYSDLEKSFSASQNASSEVASLMYYLKMVITRIKINYTNNYQIDQFYTNSFLGFIIDILEVANTYTTQVVPIPKSVKTKKSQIIKKSLIKYVSNSHIVQFTHFKIGVDYDPHSALYLIFYNAAINMGNSAVMQACFKIHNNSNIIAKILFYKKIYAAPELSMPFKDIIHGAESLSLYLIGFVYLNHSSTNSEAPQTLVELIYSNTKDHIKLIKKSPNKKIIQNCNDSWIINSGFSLSERYKEAIADKYDSETIRIKFDLAYLEKLHKSNLKSIKKKLKIPKKEKE